MHVPGYAHFGGKHGESAALKNLLAFAGVKHPGTGQPLSEALCFGIAGGIGAGYSFCPSVPRHGCFGSGVSVVGRYQSYATGASWYQGFCDRVGIKTRITESTGKGKAYQNLVAELEAGRPTVVWVSRSHLPFLGNPYDSANLWMHSFLIYALDEEQGLAHGADRAPTRVTLTLDELAEARSGICSHKNRTLTIDPPRELPLATLQAAVREGIRACTRELLQGRMKTFSLPGLETWAAMITNDKNKDGWLRVFGGSGLMYCALRDVFDSIETAGTGGGLYRGLYADFLAEAAGLLKNDALAELSTTYRQLGEQWTELAEAALPNRVKSFKQTKDMLKKKRQLFEEKGEKAAGPISDQVKKQRLLEAEMKLGFPLDEEETAALLSGLRERIVALHAAECAAAKELQRAAG